jgi:hypothetical protein
MNFKLNSSSGEQRRLPQVEEDTLVLSLSSYERIARDIIKELKRSKEELAIALKSKGLAEQLHNVMENGGGPSTAPAPAAAIAAAGADEATKPVAKRAVEPSRKVLPPASKKPKPEEQQQEEEIPVAAVAGPSKSTRSKKEEKTKETKKQSEKKASKTTSSPSTRSQKISPADINRIWIKTNPEFPLKSGKFPCYVKGKPLQHGYFTIAVGVVKTILSDFVHGNIEMVSVDDPNVTFAAAYTVKEAEHRVPGNVGSLFLQIFVSKPEKIISPMPPLIYTNFLSFLLNFVQHKGSRYFTQIAALRKGLNLKEGDVIYFMEGEEPQQLKVGVWPKGSPEANTFTQRLIDDQS